MKKLSKGKRAREAADVVIRVDSRLRMRADLPGEALADLQNLCQHKNPAFWKAKAMGFFPGKGEKPQVSTWDIDGGELSLPRGTLHLVREVLAEHGMSWRIEDHRSDPGSCDSIPDFQIEPWAHQREMVDAMLARENALVLGETGSGKTSAVLAAIGKVKRPALVVVWNSALMKQWIERIQAELGLAPRDIGYIRGGKVKLMPVTVAMQQTLANFDDAMWQKLNSYFGFVGCDEVQKFAAKTFLNVIDRCSARYRIGVSKSEKRKDGKHFLIHEQFGPVELNVDRKRMVQEGRVLDVKVCLIPTAFEAPWYLQSQRIAELMRDGCDWAEIRRTMAREYGDEIEDINKIPIHPDFNRVLGQMQEDSERDAVLLEFVEGHTAFGQQGLIFSHRVQHCRRIESALTGEGIKCGLMIGGKDHERTFEHTATGLRSGSLRVGIGTYQALGTGLDFPSVEFGVAMTPIHTNKEFFGQVRGRLCRVAAGKGEPRIYVPWDMHVFGDEPLDTMCRWNADVQVLWDGKWMDAKKLRKERKYDKAKNTKRGGKRVQL